MPFLFEKKHIPREHDKRVKLTPEDKEEIRRRYLQVGGISQRALAEEYGVSRRLIVFIIYPERQKENYRQRVENGGSKQYYDREKHNKYMQTHRLHKKKLDKKGLLDENEKE